MLKQIVVLSCLAWMTAVLIQYRDLLDINKYFMYNTSPGPCELILEDGGSEDMEYIGNGIVIISSGYGQTADKGAVKSLDLKTNKVVTMTINGVLNRDHFMESPHGITSWKDETGQVYIYVITHPPLEDRIEVFKVVDKNTLEYEKTITDPLFKYMNDLVAVGKDIFYITKFLHYRDRIALTLEFMTQITWGGIQFYNGKQSMEVVHSGLLNPNGINISPDKKSVYVAEFGYKKLLGYRILDSGHLDKTWEMFVDSHVDNIYVDSKTGDLWIGCHPFGYRIYAGFEWFASSPSPAQVLRFKMKDNTVTSIEQIYADDGAVLQGTSVGIYVEGKLVVGTVFKKALVCNVTYLSN